jgi:acyl carrier protein
VESFILARLAEEDQRDVDELREELLVHGAEMPYDSILLVELLSTVRERFGVKLKPTQETARAMRSVRGFAERVCIELDAADSASPDAERNPSVRSEGEDHHD